jgi:hypothetical protein
MVDQVAMATLAAPHFDRENVLRRTIKLLERERLDEGAHMAHRKNDHDIDVVGQPRLPVERPGSAACNEVRYAKTFEPNDERLE